jgi:hypothetical protein
MTRYDSLPTLKSLSTMAEAADAHAKAVLAAEEAGTPSLALVDGLRLDADRLMAAAVRWRTAEDRAPSSVTKVRRMANRAARLRSLALRLRPRALAVARLGRLGTVTTTG